MDEEELDKGYGNGKNNGAHNTPIPSAKGMQPTSPRV
jgi:hypothetical protein